MRKSSLRELLKLDHDYTVESDKAGIQLTLSTYQCVKVYLLTNLFFPNVPRKYITIIALSLQMKKLRNRN